MHSLKNVNTRQSKEIIVIYADYRPTEIANADLKIILLLISCIRAKYFIEQF